MLTFYFKYNSVKNFRDMSSKHGTFNGGIHDSLETSRNQTNTSNSIVANKYNSVDARYHSIKNLPPDLRMKLSKALRQKMDSNDQTNGNVVHASDMYHSPTYRVSPYNQGTALNGVGAITTPSETLSPYKTPPFNPSYLQVMIGKYNLKTLSNQIKGFCLRIV